MLCAVLVKLSLQASYTGSRAGTRFKFVHLPLKKEQTQQTAIPFTKECEVPKRKVENFEKEN